MAFMFPYDSRQDTKLVRRWGRPLRTMTTIELSIFLSDTSLARGGDIHLDVLRHTFPSFSPIVARLYRDHDMRLSAMCEASVIGTTLTLPSI